MFHDNQGATIAKCELPTKRTASKRKSYDVFFKLKAIECAEKTSKKVAARETGMDAKRIQE